MEGSVESAIMEAKSKLEKTYGVRISTSALQLAVRSPVVGSKLVLDDAAIPKEETAVKILDGACKLVLQKFGDCVYEREFYEKAYELRRALVELVELYRDTKSPLSQSWVNRLRWERDSASIYMIDFLTRWQRVVASSGQEMLSLNVVDFMRKWKVDPAESEIGRVAKDFRQFLDDITDQLTKHFWYLLTVRDFHVAEVVSSLTDVPVTQILPSVDFDKKKAIYMTNQRVINQEHVIWEVFETLVAPKQMTMRPRGIFLLLGPPGVGKTEIAKAVAEHWYCDARRLVEIDMSEYAEPLESASCDLLEWSKEKHQALRHCLAEAVVKRPYSVIVLDKIDKAPSVVTRVLLELLNYDDAPYDIEVDRVDFSKSIIFMTSNVGSNQLQLSCQCFRRNEDLWKQFRHNRFKFYENHECTLKGSGPERALVEARKFFSTDLLDSFDKVFVVERFSDPKAVARVLLREIVREATGERFVVHASNNALDVLILKAAALPSKGGKAFRESILEHVIPRISAAEGHNNVLYVDTLVGTIELSFRFQTHKQSVDDWYFKLQDGTFDESLGNLRMKVGAAHKILRCQSLFSPLFHQYIVDIGGICNRFAMCPKFPIPGVTFLVTGQSRDVAMDNLPTVEQKKKIKNVWRRLEETDSGLSEATRIIVDDVVKIIDAPLDLPDSPARHYLFLGLKDDAKVGLVNLLTESFGTDDGKSLFTYVKLDNNCRGDEVKKLLIKEVKENPRMVLLFDGVEFADDVLYGSLLEILDKGTLDNGEGYCVDFQKTIVIVMIEAANKPKIGTLFNYQKSVLHNMAKNQNVNRFRTELLYRVDEIIFFDPLLPEHGGICRMPKCDIPYMSWLENVFVQDLFSGHCLKHI